MIAKKTLALILLFFSSFAFALNPSEDIALNLRADTFFAKPGDSIQIVFDIYNPLPSNDKIIDRIDVFLFGIEDLDLKLESWQQNSWQHSYSERFGHQFFINNAENQPLIINLKASNKLKTGSIEGFYSFQKLSGTPALSDGVKFEIKINALPQGQSTPLPSKTNIPAKEQELNNIILGLIVIIIILTITLIFFIKKSTKQKTLHKETHHKK